jgi:hypothetical protein
MKNPNVYGGNDPVQMEANNTSAFNCRQAVGNPYKLSPHSHGTSIDVNPVQNPYRDVNGKWWPENGLSYIIDRSPVRAGMLTKDSYLTEKLRYTTSSGAAFGIPAGTISTSNIADECQHHPREAGCLLRRSAERLDARRLHSRRSPTRASRHCIRATDLRSILTVVHVWSRTYRADYHQYSAATATTDRPRSIDGRRSVRKVASDPLWMADGGTPRQR